MMLQIDHRESHDVDIFLQDPQFLPFLDPRTKDFKFEIVPSDYNGDGARFLKLAFEDVGEIDFIASPFLTDAPTLQQKIEGIETKLETVCEIIAKKVYYRAASLKPRDIFDIAAAAQQQEKLTIEALRPYKQQVLTAIETINRLNPEFVDTAISQLQIREKFQDVAKAAIPIAKKTLQAV